MKKIALIIALSLPMMAVASDAPEDKALAQCLNGANNTLQMNSCYSTAVKAWDTALNKAYQKALTSMNNDQKAKLRDAQRNWIKYRDSWLATSKATFNQGTMAGIQVGAQAVELNKNQTLMLRSLVQGDCANPADCG